MRPLALLAIPCLLLAAPARAADLGPIHLPYAAGGPRRGYLRPAASAARRAQDRRASLLLPRGADGMLRAQRLRRASRLRAEGLRRARLSTLRIRLFSMAAALFLPAASFLGTWSPPLAT
jgi:hypothetical protein